MIPKIIHQIWIGNQEIPEREKAFIEKCKNLHPDWEYKFWRNEDIKEIILGYESFVKKISRFQKPAYLTDFIRILVLYKYGGVYLDVDIELNQSLNKLNLSKDFIISIAPKVITRFQNCFIAASKNNEFLEYLCSLTKEGDNIFWGPGFISKKYKEFYFLNKCQDFFNNTPNDFYDQIVFTGELLKNIECPQNHCFLPRKYFFEGYIGTHKCLASHYPENKKNFTI